MTAFAEYLSASAHKLLTDNRVVYRAASILHGIETRDGDPTPILPTDQAQDVLRWGSRRWCRADS